MLGAREIPLFCAGQSNDVQLGSSELHDFSEKKSVIDVTFVDDEAADVGTKTATALMKAIPIVLMCFAKALCEFGFKLNFAEGN